MTIAIDAAYERLAVEVLRSAVTQVQRRGCVSAYRWLRSDDARAWCDALGVDFVALVERVEEEFARVREECGPLR